MVWDKVKQKITRDMNNFINILKKEIMMSLVQSRFTIILIFVTVVIATGLFSMYRDYTQRLENFEVLAPEIRFMYQKTNCTLPNS